MFNQSKLLNDVEKNLINFLTELSLVGEGDKHIASFTVEHHTYGTWINLMYKTNLFAEDQYLEVIPLEINELKKKEKRKKFRQKKNITK